MQLHSFLEVFLIGNSCVQSTSAILWHCDVSIQLYKLRTSKSQNFGNRLEVVKQNR